MWQSEMISLLRPMIGDIANPPKYDDDSLSQLVLLAAQLVKTELAFAVNYIVDIDGFELIPDPTVIGGRDDSFINLTVIKAACIVDQGEARQSAGKAIAIRDNDSSIDLTKNSGARLEILKQGWCKTFQDVKRDFINGPVSAGAGNSVGVAVISAFCNEYGSAVYNYGRYYRWPT